MGREALKFIFFGNYFIGILAVALTIESTLQLKIPFNSVSYYMLLFVSPIVYYTYAYMGAAKNDHSSNPRVAWYSKHRPFVYWSQLILSLICILLSMLILMKNMTNIEQLPFHYWLVIGVVMAMGILYYGLVPVFFFDLNLRNTGWFKPFIIGFVWAATANLLPIIMLRIETGVEIPRTDLWVFLFIKNWMFCTVNAIMFDIKDYEIDSNNQLKTFVVRIGLKKTIIRVLMPLLLIGFLSLLIFVTAKHFPPQRILLNVVPFLLTALVAWSMNRKKEIFYYLVVIDGLILVKALCGILAMMLENKP